jgi:hypothetical protein
MAEKKNAICSICGSSYHKCLSCRDSMKLQPWKMFTDTSEHYKVFQAVRGYSTGVYNKDEFRSRLKNIDLSDLDSYREHIKAIIKDALKEEPVVEPVIEETATIVTKEEMVIEKPIISRRRNYKTEMETEL